MNHVWVHIWPPIDAELDQLTALRRSIAPITAGAGIDEVLAQGQVPLAGDRFVPVAGRFYYQPGSGVQFSVGPPPTDLLTPMDDYAQQGRARAAPRHRVPVRAARDGRGGGGHRRRARPRRHRRPRAGGPRAGRQQGGHRGRRRHHAHRRRIPKASRGCCSVGDPTRALGAVSEAECSRIIAALDLAESMRVPVEWYALSAGARIAMNSGTENMDWVARRAQAHRRVHPGRRRDQHRGRRHQRRRPAVLERRGDDAHAHQGHPGHDAGQRDGAHRQAVAGLLRRRVGRGQLRYRRLRPRHGSERPGAVLGAGPARCPGRRAGALRARLRRTGGDRAAAGADRATRSTAT